MIIWYCCVVITSRKQIEYLRSWSPKEHRGSILFLPCAATLFVPWFQLFESSSPLRALRPGVKLGESFVMFHHPESQSTRRHESSSSFSNDWSASLVTSIDVLSSTPKPCRRRPRQDGALSESWEQNDGNLVFHYDCELRCSYFEVEWSKRCRVSVGEREHLEWDLWGWRINAWLADFAMATWCPR